ncbi:hypothetical protein SCP_0509130 [Sparassis crispa]|uniref:Uncharacterized protein n=1 Tax=Sparassis crispa TaxID=139825 RepID=A0A401GNR8_9APHY|nr:hypothetical protein SCP_0509130 [Sparassis crispa]GBE83856.1 hypothetical protein SCP_0509130 [Sparassis crispa]
MTIPFTKYVASIALIFSGAYIWDKRSPSEIASERTDPAYMLQKMDVSPLLSYQAKISRSNLIVWSVTAPSFRAMPRTCKCGVLSPFRSLG